MVKKSGLTVTLIVLSLAGSSAFAQGSSSLSMTGKNTKTKASAFHLTAELSTSSNLYSEKSANQEGSTDLEIAPSFVFGSRYSLGAISALSQEKAAGETRDTILSNTEISLGIKGPEITRDLGSSFVIKGVAPTNEKTRKEDSYQGGAGLSGSLIFKKGITTLKYTMAGARSFHQFTVNAESSPNIQYALTQSLGLELELTKGLSLTTSGSYKQGWTYRNFSRQTYGYTAGLGYEFMKSWIIGASVGTEGNAMKANGTDSNIRFYNENTSVVKASVTFTN